MPDFFDIDESRPLGTQKVKDIDNAERETRTWMEDCLRQISGYPDVAAIILPAWTTANRPTGTLKERLTGYNSETKRIEIVSGGTWSPLPFISEDSLSVGGVRVTIGTTAPASPVVNKELWIDITNEVFQIYTASGWKMMGAAYK